MALRCSVLAYLRYFSRPHAGCILVCVPWYCFALKTDIYAIITNVLMLLTIATVISCWRSLWQRQDFVREKERENIQSCSCTLLWRVVTTMNLSLSRAITTVMIPYFMILSVMVDMHHQSSETPWLSSAKLMSHSSLQPNMLTLFVLFPLGNEEFQLFCSKTQQKVLRKYIFTLWCGVQ